MQSPIRQFRPFIHSALVTAIWTWLLLSGWVTVSLAADVARRAPVRSPVVLDPPAEKGNGYLIPLVVSLKAGARDDLSERTIRSGWSSSLGIYNTNSRAEAYRFTFYRQNGEPQVSYVTRPVPAGQNIFTTPEIMACIMRSPDRPNAPCIPERTFSLEAGDPEPLVDRTFIGYLTVEEITGQDGFIASSWIARGGADLVNPICDSSGCRFTSFGYNRAAFRVPAVHQDVADQAPTRSLRFLGTYVAAPGSAGSMPELKRVPSHLRCSTPGGTPLPCVPDFEDGSDPGVSGIPLGWDGFVTLVNSGAATITGRFQFTRFGGADPSARSRTLTIAPGEQVTDYVSSLFPGLAGRGVLEFTAETGQSRLAGVLFQSDARFQFFSYGVEGMESRWSSNETEPATPQARREYIVPLAACFGGRSGMDSALSLYNPSDATATIHLSLIDAAGRRLSERVFQLAPHGARLHELSPGLQGEEFVGSVKLTADSPILLASTLARGGFDQEAFGWQSFAFTVTPVAADSLPSGVGLVFPAVNESLTYLNAPPPTIPGSEDTSHVNGFDMAVQVVNLDSVPVQIQFRFLRRYVTEGSADDLVVSRQSYRLESGASRLVTLGVEFRELDPEDLRDGMLMATVSDPATGRPLHAKVAGSAVESDRGFKWFGYGVDGQVVQ